MLNLLQSALGLGVFVSLAWLLAEKRQPFPYATAARALLLQFLLTAALLKLPPFKSFFLGLNDILSGLEHATNAGTSFVFGYLGGGKLPFAPVDGTSSFVLAFRALPLILVMSALSSLLFHWRILPWVVRGLSWVLHRALNIGGAVGLAAAAEVFLGMIESPLLIRPYLARMSRHELFGVMSCGMATVSGTVMVLYASFLSAAVPDAMGHILAASLANVPAALLIAHLMVPPDGPATEGDLVIPLDVGSSTDAVTRGTLAGVELLVNIIAMLVVFVALVSLANLLIAQLPDIAGQPLTLQRSLGWIMAPVVWLTGIPWAEAPAAGALMGTKTVLNELIAYLDLAALPPEALSPRSRLIMVYALCGFANLGSLGILLGGMGAMVPERRDVIVALGGRSIVSGTLATLMTGAMVGLLT